MRVPPEYANRILAGDPEFQALRRRFNALGIWRFITYVVAIIFAISAGINNEIGWVLGICAVSFVIVMTLEYNRSATRARQQRRCIELGLIGPEDIR